MEIKSKINNNMNEPLLRKPYLSLKILQTKNLYILNSSDLKEFKDLSDCYIEVIFEPNIKTHKSLKKKYF